MLVAAWGSSKSFERVRIPLVAPKMTNILMNKHTLIFDTLVKSSYIHRPEADYKIVKVLEETSLEAIKKRFKWLSELPNDKLILLLTEDIKQELRDKDNL